MVKTLKEVTKCEVLFLLEDEIIGNDNLLCDDLYHDLMRMIRQYHPSDFESMLLQPLSTLFIANLLFGQRVVTPVQLYDYPCW